MPKLPEWKIERYILGELPEDELRRMDQLRAEDAAFDAEMRAKIDRLQASNQEILAKYPAAEIAAMVRQRAASAKPGAEQTTRGAARTGRSPELHVEPRGASATDRADEQPREQKSRPFFVLPQVVFPAALAAALALFILFSGQFAFLGLPNGNGAEAAGSGGNGTGGGTSIQGLEGDTGIRLKGMEPGIQVFRKRGDDIELLQPGTQATEGDVLQLGFFAPEAEYAVLFSVDGRGVVTLHSPISARQSAELTEQQRVLIDAAYRLDNAPRFERFYLITSNSELDAAGVLGEVRDYIRINGQFPNSSGELNSNQQLADISEGQTKWYVFTLKK